MVSQPKIDYINRLINESLSEGDDTIELKGKFIGDEGVEALVQSTKLDSIEDLDLSNNNITWRGAVQLFKCDRFRNLKRLYINDNNISKFINFLSSSSNKNIVLFSFKNIAVREAYIFYLKYFYLITNYSIVIFVICYGFNNNQQ